MIMPLGRPSDYLTYRIVQPPDIEIKASCEQVGCPSWLHGWETVVDEATDLGRAQAAYIRTQARRTFREQRDAAGLTHFRFEAGQRCFAEHKTRQEVYARIPGDRRIATGPAFIHRKAADWVADFGEHQLKIKEEIEKG